MELTVLGSCGGWSSAGRACSGYLLRTVHTRLWVDAGSGTFAELLRHTGLDDLDAVWISHLHPDHVVDVTQAWQAITYGGARAGRPLPVYGPPGWAARLDALLGQPGAGAAAFEVHELHDGHTAVHGDVELATVAVPHGVPAFGLRAASRDGHLLAYSGDCGPEVGGVADGAGLLLCEAYLALPGARPSATVKTPEQAGRVASRAGAELLVLTHLHPDADPEYARRQAATTFRGPVAVAGSGQTYEVPR